MIIIIVLLSLVAVSNSTITFYLWSQYTKEVKEEEVR
jgi:flagellar basal body-associated protein FliL